MLCQQHRVQVKGLSAFAVRLQWNTCSMDCTLGHLGHLGYPVVLSLSLMGVC